MFVWYEFIYKFSIKKKIIKRIKSKSFGVLQKYAPEKSACLSSKIYPRKGCYQNMLKNIQKYE